MLAVQALVTTTAALLYASGEPLQERYFIALWLPFAAGLAASARLLGRVGRRAPAALLVLVALHYGRDFHGVARECRSVDLRSRYREHEDGMRVRGATHGYADHDTAYLATYFADERIQLTCYDGAFAREARGRAAVAREPFPVVVFAEEQHRDQAQVEASVPALVVERWTHGRLSYLRLRHHPGRWISAIQGEPERDSRRPASRLEPSSPAPRTSCVRCEAEAADLVL